MPLQLTLVLRETKRINEARLFLITFLRSNVFCTFLVVKQYLLTELASSRRQVSRVGARKPLREKKK